LYDICPPFQFSDDSDYATGIFVSQHLRLRLDDAVHGRVDVGWGGKTTLAARIGGAGPGSAAARTDDIAWASARWSLYNVIDE
jgi:hypothetical protein